MEELEFTRNTYTSVFRSKTARPRTRAQSSPHFSFLARSRATSFLLSRSRARAGDRACPSFLSRLAPISFSSLRIFGPSRKARTLAERRWDSWRREPPPPLSIQYFPLCYYSFSIRLLRNCIENNRNRNQYTRYIAIIRAIVMTVFYT